MISQTMHPEFGPKHRAYIRAAQKATVSVAEGAVRAGKTIDNIAAFASVLNRLPPDRIHLATGATAATAKLNIGVANGYGLENIFRGRCRWTKYRGNEALSIRLKGREYIVIFVGGAKADSYKRIRGNSFGMWIATEINLHHVDTIKEAFNRQLAAKVRRVFWDLNPSAPGAWIYKDYIDRFSEQLGDKYNYQHFTIRDNLTITQERLKEIAAQYVPGSIWYRRDILGQRCIAEGLIYSNLAALIATNSSSLTLPKSAVQDMIKHHKIIKINAGVDFGGNGSGHAFVAVGYTLGYESLIVLRSERYVEHGTDPETGRKLTDIDPVDLSSLFLRFVRHILADYGFISAVYADSEASVLIRGLRTALLQAGLGDIKVVNARKSAILDRIQATSSLSAQKRLLYTEDNQ